LTNNVSLAKLVKSDQPETKMETVNLYQAKTKLSQLVERAAAGEEIVIAKAGRPLARLVPLAHRTGPRPLGLFAGQIVIGDDFDDPLPEDMEAAFRGEMP
jgi:prevent-host-death family protein